MAAGWRDPDCRPGTRDPFLPLTCAGSRPQTRQLLAGLGSAGSGSVQLPLSLFNKRAWREARPHAAVLLIANRPAGLQAGHGAPRAASVRLSARPCQKDGRGPGTERRKARCCLLFQVLLFNVTRRPCDRVVQSRHRKPLQPQTPTNRGEKQTAATARAPRGRGGTGSRSSARDEAHGQQRGSPRPSRGPCQGRGLTPPSCKAARNGAKTGAPGIEPKPESPGAGQPRDRVTGHCLPLSSPTAAPSQALKQGESSKSVARPHLQHGARGGRAQKLLGTGEEA